MLGGLEDVRVVLNSSSRVGPGVVRPVVRVVLKGPQGRAPDELETQEAEARMRNGRGEADLGALERSVEIMKDRASPVGICL